MDYYIDLVKAIALVPKPIGTAGIRDNNTINRDVCAKFQVNLDSVAMYDPDSAFDPLRELSLVEFRRFVSLQYATTMRDEWGVSRHTRLWKHVLDELDRDSGNQRI